MDRDELRLDLVDALSDATCTGGLLRLECGDIADDILDGGIDLGDGLVLMVGDESDLVEMRHKEHYGPPDEIPLYRRFCPGVPTGEDDAVLAHPNAGAGPHAE